MCGIAGWIASTGALREADLRRMIAVIRHRGPDDEGFWAADVSRGRERVALGHCRLAIIDLAGGRQPMSSADGRQVLTFNGEIYNYRDLRRELSAVGHTFRTMSDTEVVLEAYRRWGTACLSRLRGMFAFALWDASCNSLFLARDRFGKKPLFYLADPGVFAFASEIKALLELPGVRRQLSPAALARYLEYRYVPGPDTLFSGISKLPPGHFGLWQDGRLEITRYYLPPDATARSAEPRSGDVIGDFLSVLDEAVCLRMISDVPFGAFLSGGLDSSSVVALMSRHSAHPIKTFSVGFVESPYSELAYAGEVARHFRTDHHEITVDAATVMAELPRMTRFRDAPVGEPADIPIYKLSEAAAEKIKMVLTGEGADEILGGYPKHIVERFVAHYQRVVPPAAHRNIVMPLADRLPYRHHRLHTLASNAGVYDLEERMARWFGALSHQDRMRLSSLPGGAPANVVLPRSAGCALRAVLAFDQQSWLPDNLLERGDRMTMAASIETRMPFMDHVLAAFASALPDRYRIRGMTTKWILRKAMSRILPERILTRPKVGFRVPVNEWFRTSWRGFLVDTLTATSSLTMATLPASFVRAVLADHIEGRRNHEKLLWTLLTLELFQREYRLDAADGQIHGRALATADSVDHWRSATDRAELGARAAGA